MAENLAENFREVKNIQLPSQFTEEILDSIVAEIVVNNYLDKKMDELNGKLENASWENWFSFWAIYRLTDFEQNEVNTKEKIKSKLAEIMTKDREFFENELLVYQEFLVYLSGKTHIISIFDFIKSLQYLQNGIAKNRYSIKTLTNLVQSKREVGESLILSLDFDDTLHFDNGKIGVPNLFLINFVKEIIQENDTLQILTSRSGEKPEITAFAKKHGLNVELIACGFNYQESTKQNKLNEISNQNPTKPIIHIDDGENYKPLNENTNWCTIFNVIIGSETRINELWKEFEQNQILN